VAGARFKKLVNHLEEGLMALFLAVMTVLTFVQVVLRYVFNTGWIWSLEATTYTFAWLVLLGMAYGVRTRSHIAVDLVVGRLRGRVLLVASVLAVLICISYAVLMFYGGAVLVGRLVELGNEARDLPVKRWLLLIMLPTGFVLLAFRFLEMFWQLVTGSIEGLGFGEREEAPLPPAAVTGRPEQDS
jgi:C4-dicarboxylate transporter DctQ subunit